MICEKRQNRHIFGTRGNRGQESHGEGKYRQIGSFPSYLLYHFLDTCARCRRRRRRCINPNYTHRSCTQLTPERKSISTTMMMMKKEFSNMLLLIFSYPRSLTLSQISAPALALSISQCLFIDSPCPIRPPIPIHDFPSKRMSV